MEYNSRSLLLLLLPELSNNEYNKKLLLTAGATGATTGFTATTGPVTTGPATRVGTEAPYTGGTYTGAVGA